MKILRHAKIKEIVERRAILSEIFKIRNIAVKALDDDNQDAYNAAVDELSDAIVRLGAI